jgi:hypothetical protein
MSDVEFLFSNADRYFFARLQHFAALAEDPGFRLADFKLKLCNVSPFDGMPSDAFDHSDAFTQAITSQRKAHIVCEGYRFDVRMLFC